MAVKQEFRESFKKQQGLTMLFHLIERPENKYNRSVYATKA